MPVTYDIRTDFLYQKGEKEGIEKGMEKGIELKERVFVARGWEKGMTPEAIAELADMPVELVNAIIRELELESKGEG